MKTQKQILAMLLLASALITASCGSGDTTATDTAAVATEAQTSAETLSPLDQTVASLPAKDFDGYEFTIMDRNSEHTPWHTYDVFAEGENGDAINDAVFKRNQVIEELYNIKIKEEGVYIPVDNMQKLIIAGEIPLMFSPTV